MTHPQSSSSHPVRPHRQGYRQHPRRAPALVRPLGLTRRRPWSARALGTLDAVIADWTRSPASTATASAPFPSPPASAPRSPSCARCTPDSSSSRLCAQQRPSASSSRTDDENPEAHAAAIEAGADAYLRADEARLETVLGSYLTRFLQLQAMLQRTAEMIGQSAAAIPPSASPPAACARPPSRSRRGRTRHRRLRTARRGPARPRQRPLGRQAHRRCPRYHAQGPDRGGRGELLHGRPDPRQ